MTTVHAELLDVGGATAPPTQAPTVFQGVDATAGEGEAELAPRPGAAELLAIGDPTLPIDPIVPELMASALHMKHLGVGLHGARDLALVVARRVLACPALAAEGPPIALLRPGHITDGGWI